MATTSLTTTRAEASLFWDRPAAVVAPASRPLMQMLEGASGTSDGGTRVHSGSGFRFVVIDGAILLALRLPRSAAPLEEPALRPARIPVADKPRLLPPHRVALQWIRDATGLSDERIGRLLDVTRQTLNRWDRGEPIADANRQRLLAVRDVLERAASRRPTPAQLAAWLDTPQGSDGLTPAQHLEAGRIDRARLLSMVSPSPRLVPPPAWVRRPVPDQFRAGEERGAEALPPEAEGASEISEADEALDTISDPGEPAG